MAAITLSIEGFELKKSQWQKTEALNMLIEHCKKEGTVFGKFPFQHVFMPMESYAFLNGVRMPLVSAMEEIQKM